MGGHLEVYRCDGCKKLIPWCVLKKRGGCICGSSYIRGNAHPTNFIEMIQLWYWTHFKYKEEYAKQ